jgi:hypothetical protein
MRTRAVKRLIRVTGVRAGDSLARISCQLRLPFRIVCGQAHDDNGLHERMIRESRLDWVMLRPGVLTSRPETPVLVN